MLEIGTTLRDARERRGLDLAECERATRIRAGQLRALEEGRFEKLPEPPYVRGFLRSYAGLLGLDAERLVAEYDRLVGQDQRLSEHDLQPLPPPERPIDALRRGLPRPRRPRRPGRAAALRWMSVGAIVVIGVLAWTGLSGHHSSPPETRPSSRLVPRPPAPTAPRPAQRPAATAAPLLAVTGLPPYGSYLEVRRGGADGEAVFEGTLAPGSARRWSVAHPLWIRVGWTPSLRARVSGRPVALSGGTANFLVVRDGVRPQ